MATTPQKKINLWFRFRNLRMHVTSFAASAIFAVFRAPWRLRFCVNYWLSTHGKGLEATVVAIVLLVIVYFIQLTFTLGSHAKSIIGVSLQIAAGVILLLDQISANERIRAQVTRIAQSTPRFFSANNITPFPVCSISVRCFWEQAVERVVNCAWRHILRLSGVWNVLVIPGAPKTDQVVKKKRIRGGEKNRVRNLRSLRSQRSDITGNLVAVGRSGSLCAVTLWLHQGVVDSVAVVILGRLLRLHDLPFVSDFACVPPCIRFRQVLCLCPIRQTQKLGVLVLGIPSRSMVVGRVAAGVKGIHIRLI